jgi:hypothetical protein
MLKTKKCAGNSDNSFQDSHGWCEKFTKRKTLSLQQRTIISQKLPSEFETNLNEYQYDFSLGHRNQYSLIQIGKVYGTASFSICRTNALLIPKERNYI